MVRIGNIKTDGENKNKLLTFVRKQILLFATPPPFFCILVQPGLVSMGGGDERKRASKKVTHRGREALEIRDRAAFPGLCVQYVPDVFSKEQCRRNRRYMQRMEYVTAVTGPEDDPTVHGDEAYAWFSDGGDMVYGLTGDHGNALVPRAWTLKFKGIRTSVHTHLKGLAAERDGNTGRKVWAMTNSLFVTWHRRPTSRTLRRASIKELGDLDPWLGPSPRIFYAFFGKSRWIRMRPRAGSSSSEWHLKRQGETGQASRQIDMLIRPGSILVVEGTNSFRHWTREVCPLGKIPDGADPDTYWTFEMAFMDARISLLKEQHRIYPESRLHGHLDAERRITPDHCKEHEEEDDDGDRKRHKMI